MRVRWRGLELPSQVACDKSTLTSGYGKFVAEPFERGFGTTVGNSLRRILLSSLEGSAITRIKLRGAEHEYTAIPGVLEDVVDIVLNVKSLVVKNHSEKPHILRITKGAAGVVTGADVEGDEAVEVVNRDHVIATLTDDVPFELEMIVENGRGYVPAGEQIGRMYEKNDDIGYIPVDAAFSPVTRVRYLVEETRVGQKTNYDKLTLEIWTNGATGPEMALVEAAKIFRKHLNPFVQYDQLGEQVHTQPKGGGTGGLDPATEAKLAMPLSDLNLSVRAMNCLDSENIRTVRELASRTEDSLLEVRNFGETTLNEVREKLSEIGLRLGLRLPAPPPAPPSAF